MKTYQTTVERDIEITIDETKFTPQFMKDFRDSFYPFETIEDHVEFLAGVINNGMRSNEFVEGYGVLSEMGITFDRGDAEVWTLK